MCLTIYTNCNYQISKRNVLFSTENIIHERDCDLCTKNVKIAV